MATIKTSKVNLPKVFQIELAPGWSLDIDTNTVPTRYTLTRGKKSMTVEGNVVKDLIKIN